MKENKSFSVIKLVGFVLGALLFISIAANWYGENVNIVRYCDKIDATINILRDVITKKNPAGDGSRREYIIASKLLFLIPKKSTEDVENYLMRVRTSINLQCY